MPGPATLLFIAAVFVVAGLVKGAIGLGLPTVAVGLLGLTMPPAEAAALLVVPSLVTNAWQLLAGPRFGPLLRRLWPMLAGIAAGTWLAAGRLAAAAGPQAATGADKGPGVALGAALIAYGLFGLMQLPLAVPPRAERFLGPAVGVVNGLITAATGVFVLPSVPYLQALGLQREDLVQALGLTFTASTIALAAALAGHGGFRVDGAAGSVVALVSALVGMQAGTWLRAQVRQETFRTWFFAGLLGLGADLLLSGLR